MGQSTFFSNISQNCALTPVFGVKLRHDYSRSWGLEGYDALREKAKEGLSLDWLTACSYLRFQNPNCFRCSSQTCGKGSMKSASVRVAGWVLLRIAYWMSGSSRSRRRMREA